MHNIPKAIPLIHHIYASITTGFPNLGKLAISVGNPTANLPSATLAGNKGGGPVPVRLPNRGLREPQRPGTWKQLLTKLTIILLRPTHGALAELGNLTAEQRYQPRQNGVDPTLTKASTDNPQLNCLTSSSSLGVAGPITTNNRALAFSGEPLLHHWATECHFTRHRVTHATACVADKSFKPKTTDETYAKVTNERRARNPNVHNLCYANNLL